jgi:hypothetical protein
VAHEPPLLELLPDADEQRVRTDGIVETFRRHGQAAAWMQFMRNAGFDADDSGAVSDPPGPPSEQAIADGARFFAHELQGTTRYLPDIAALRTGSSQIVVGVGVDSTGLVTHRTSTALAALLDISTVDFPGGHGGFLDQPKGFADVVRSVLIGEARCTANPTAGRRRTSTS